MKWITEVAASKRLAAALIAALAAACLLGGLNEAFFSPWVMAALLGVLGVNTTACTMRMLASLRGGIGPESALEGRLTNGLMSAAGERARESLRMLGYRVKEVEKNGEITILGKQGLPVRWALIVLHSALVALLMSVGVEMLVRSERTLVLAPGAFFEDRPESYVRVRDGAIGGSYGRFYGNTVRIWRRNGIDWCDLSILRRGPGGRARVRFSRSSPATLLGGTLRLRQTGPAPVLVLRKGDEALMEACVNVLAGGGRGPAHDEVPLASGRRLLLTPQDEGASFSATLLDGGRPALEGSLRPGGRLEGGGLSLDMPEVRRWAEITFVEDPALEAVLASAALCVVSLAAYALMYGRSMTVAVSADGAVRISGRSDRFNPLFREEMDGVLAALCPPKPAAAERGAP